MKIFLSLIAMVLCQARPCCPLSSKVKGREREPSRPTCEHEADPPCLTPGCIHAASRVLQSMNRKVKPCDDFYEFACGGFETSTTIIDEGQSYSTFYLADEKLQGKLKLSIEEPSSPHELRTFKLAKVLYRSCMNTSANDESDLQYQTLHNVIDKLGGWPVLEKDWKGETFNWSKSIQQCLELGCADSSLINIFVATDMKNNTKRILQLDQATPILSHETDVETEKAYLGRMVKIAVKMGADEQNATLQLKESLEFEKNLTNISWSKAARSNMSALYNPMSISELNKRYPILDWEWMFNSILPPSVRVGTDDIVNVRVPSYLSGFNDIIESTPNKIVANYILWKVIQNSFFGLTEVLGQSSQRVRAEGTKFIGKVSDLHSKKDQSIKCVGIVSLLMPIGMDALYVRNHVKGDSKEKAREMFTGLQMELEEILKQSEWMDEKTRTSALEKVASMQTQIAYPNEYLDDKKLDEFYANLELTPDNLLNNIFALKIFAMNYEFERLKKPRNRTDWIAFGLPPMINAFYDPQSNSIIVPAGLLQEVFFSNDLPHYMNYGAMGFVVGHEITHGFDNQGRGFDKTGNLVDWWEPETKVEFEKKTECLVHQYGNYTPGSDNLTLDGLKTLGENIADNGGMKLAYLRYKKLVKTNGAEPKLPALEYTPEQMFWISAANVWCIKYGAQTLETAMKTDEHSPGRFRVIGPFSNSPEFAADFNCPLGSAMNPEEKCSVW